MSTIRGDLPGLAAGGPNLHRFVLVLHFSGQVTCERIVALLNGMGVMISKRQVVRLLTAKLETFRAEDEAVLKAGLSGAYVTVDDTGARHAGKSGYPRQGALMVMSAACKQNAASNRKRTEQRIEPLYVAGPGPQYTCSRSIAFCRSSCGSTLAASAGTFATSAAASVSSTSATFAAISLTSAAATKAGIGDIEGIGDLNRLGGDIGGIAPSGGECISQHCFVGCLKSNNRAPKPSPAARSWSEHFRRCRHEPCLLISGQPDHSRRIFDGGEALSSCAKIWIPQAVQFLGSWKGQRDTAKIVSGHEVT